MKYCFPEIDHVFDTECGWVNMLVVENQALFCRLLADFYAQIENGEKGNGVISVDNAPVDMAKYADVISTFIPFDLNRKTLVSKLTATLEKTAVNQDHYENTMKVMQDLHDWLDEISFSLSCDVVYPKLSHSSIIKAAGVEFQNQDAGVAQNVLDYMELYREFDRDRLFITVNIRSYISDAETQAFCETVLCHGYHVLLLESVDRRQIESIKKVIIDNDLCEIE